MSWNWQRPDWPRFSWSAERLARAEEQFLFGAGAVEGVLRHLDDENRERLTVEAMSEKALAQNLGRPSRIALAATILARRRDYYGMLAASNQRNEVSDWLAWFAGIALEARQRSLDWIEFLIDQTRLMDALRDQLNERQQAVLMRVFRAGPDGFPGGLSAGNHVSIARTSCERER